jgi:effector-binding domain-containing protein
VHHGSFDAFQQIHTALLRWVEANNYRIVGPYREIYIQGGNNSNDATAEIQYPVEKG